MTRNTLTKYHEGLDRAKKRILAQVDEDCNEAIDNVDTLAGLFQIVADYDWLKAQVLSIIPLGVGGRYLWVEENLIHHLASEEGLDHLADQLISELNGDPYGPSVIPSRAELVGIDDRSGMLAGKRP